MNTNVFYFYRFFSINKRTTILTMCLFVSSSLFAYDFMVDGICYNVLSASELTVEVTYEKVTQESQEGSVGLIRTYSSPSQSPNLVIPSTVDYNGKTYTVIQIGWCAIGAYRDYQSMYYGGKAKNTRLISVKIPETIKIIGTGAFINCVNLTEISIPASVERIADYAFGHTNIQTLTIPENVTFLGTGLPETLTELIMLPYNPPESTHTIQIKSEVFVPVKQKYLDDDNWKKCNLVEMLTPDNNNFTYNGETPSVAWTNNLKAYTMNVSTSSLESTAGSYSTEITADFYIDNINAFSVHFPYVYTINKALLNVTVDNVNREYGDVNPIFNISYSGFLKNDNENVIYPKPTASTNATQTSDVGEYVIKLSGGDAINYDFTFIPGTLTITKAPLSITVKDTNRVYGSSNPQFELEYYGLKNGETNPLWITAPTIHTVADINSNVGQYQIKATGGILKNYELGSIGDGILNITPAQLTIRANDAVRQYYNENPAFSYKCVGFVNGENENEFLEQPILATNALLSSNVGTYEIKVSGAKSVNYNISYVCGTLNVIPRTLTAIVGNYERAYGEENPEFIVVYDGFVNEEDEEALLTKAVANTVANKTSDVGTYLIKVSGGSAENYELTYSSGLLTINKAEQTIDWIQQLDSLTIGDQVELNAKASSGLIITYTIDPTNCAEIYNAGTKTYLDCIANGEFFIVAVQEGNKNYYSSPRARKKVVIGKTRKQYDVNNDDIIDISDIVATINVIAAGQTDDKSDVNNDGKTDISDIVAIINAIANQ